MKILVFCSLFITIMISCDSEYNLPNGEHRAFIEEYDTATKYEKEFAAHIIVKEGFVMKINFSTGESIDQFDFWEKINEKRQDVYTNRGKVYSIYLFDDDE